jgi:tetratricopeptide (TPR) repeat protein
MQSNNSEPSVVVVRQILGKSGYFNGMMDSIISLKEKIEHTKDEESLLKLNNELQLNVNRMSKLGEYTEDLHETFRTIPFQTERLKQAEEYFYQGKFPEMDAVLDASKIRAEIEHLEENFLSKDDELIKKTRTRLECKSYELLIKALYGYTLIDNPKWRDHVYELLLDAHNASSNTHTGYELGFFLSSTVEREWAFELLDDTYFLAEYLEEESCGLYKAKTLRAMGNLSVNKQEIPKAIEYFGKALTQYTGLSKKNPAEYRPKMAAMLVLLGNHHTFSKNYPVALVVFEEAANILSELASSGNWEYTMELSDVMDKLGSVHLCKGEYVEACQRYEEALKIKDDNIEQNLYHILASKASTLYNLTIAHYAAQEYGKAISRAKEELDARKKLQEIDPFGQLPYRAKIRMLLGDIYLHLNRPVDAVREREKVVKIYKILAKRLPDEHLANLGEALNHCSNLYFNMKSYYKYFAMLTEALELFRKLAGADPERYSLTVVCLLANVCHYYEKISPNRKKAIEYARETYDILSSIERDETTEVAFANVKRILGLPK